MASSSSQQPPRKPRILVGATGCVATMKLGTICYELLKWADVQVVVTECARPFIDRNSLPSNLTMYSDSSEFTFWKKPKDPVLYIELQKWADMMLIAPLSSNTLAKIAAGICDNLLTTIVKIWQCEEKPLFIAPAMNTRMWKNCLTEQHLQCLVDEMSVFHIQPSNAGNSQPGPMANESDICSTLRTTWISLNP